MGYDDDIHRRCRGVAAVFVAWSKYYHPTQDSVFATKIGNFSLQFHSHTSIRPGSYILIPGKIPKSHRQIPVSASSAANLAMGAWELAENAHSTALSAI